MILVNLVSLGESGVFDDSVEPGVSGESGDSGEYGDTGDPGESGEP